MEPDLEGIGDMFEIPFMSSFPNSYEPLLPPQETEEYLQLLSQINKFKDLTQPNKRKRQQLKLLKKAFRKQQKILTERRQEWLKLEQIRLQKLRILNEKIIRENFVELPYHDFQLIKLDCPICMEKTTEHDNLDCGHQYCSWCILLLLRDFILNGKVYPDELLCPMCDAPISDETFQKLLGSFFMEKVFELREKFKVDKMVSTGKAVYCPIPNCIGYIHIINGVKATSCAVCRVSVCPDCMKCAHPTISCEEYKKSLGNAEAEMEELMMSRNWKRCPFCSAMIEKLDGCKFVKCYSNICKTHDRALCYLCGKGLNEKHHFSHYQKAGPYGESCNTMDGVQDEPLNVENNQDLGAENKYVISHRHED